MANINNSISKIPVVYILSERGHFLSFNKKAEKERRTKKRKKREQKRIERSRKEKKGAERSRKE